MDCNRDEATRAKAIAETKFSAKDIMGAKKFALKAQSLYPGLDGIPQLLAILDVYVAAENKINGELDYYEILGVNPLADDDTVRKHYRKLALSLHPDKNKSIGADGAFKYVSEAWNFLSDKDKRTTYDHKRNVRVFTQKIWTSNGGGSGAPPPTASGKNGFYNFTKSTTTRTKSTTPQTKGTSANAQTKGTSTTGQTKGTTAKTKSTTAQTKGTTNSPEDDTNTVNKKVATADPPSADKETGPTPTSVLPPSNKQIMPKTFWTVCKRCKLQYEFLRKYLNRNLLCPTCHGPFHAIEIPPPNTNGSLEVSGKGGQGASENGSNPTSNITTTSKWASFLKKTASPAAVSQAASVVEEGLEKLKGDGEEEVQPATKRRKKSSKQSNSVKAKPGVDGFVENKETGPVGSAISSGQVDINAGIKNQLIKKATMEIRKKLHEWSSEKENGKGEKGDGLANGDSNDPRTEPVPDPDFHDFDRDRSETCFEEGEVWAVYDDHDGMPRYYAVIQKVVSIDPFKMKVCWLNSTPKNNKNPNPTSAFSKAFGEFKSGKHETVSVPNYFSHKANFTKLANGNYRVFPRKKDVCALFRSNRQHKYEIVEVDEYDEETGWMTVTPLIKVAGFKTVFHRHINPKETWVVLENKVVQLSHKIPSYMLTGKESPNAPKGCFELDPAAIPGEFLQVTEKVKEDDDVEMVEKEFVSK